jgi:hypothetical protein
MIKTRLLAVGIAFGVFADIGAQAVRTVTVPPEISCAACSIQLRKVVTLTELSDTASVIGDLPVVTRDSRGNWFAASTSLPSRVGVFNSQGKLTQLIGRAGQGPGEFSTIRTMVAGPGDTLYVYDFAQRRRTVFAPDFRMLRTEQTPGSVISAAALPDGRHVINTSTFAGAANSSRAAASGILPNVLHFISPSGALGRSFAAVAPSRGAPARSAVRFVSVDAAGNIWSPVLDSYDIEVFDAAGVKREEYRIQSTWWADPSIVGKQFRGAAPSAADSSVLILHTAFRNPNYRPPPRQPGDLSRLSPAQIDSIWDARVEAVDRRSGRLLASVVVPSVYVPVNGRYIPIVKVLDDGRVVIEIFDPVLVR